VMEIDQLGRLENEMKKEDTDWSILNRVKK
jgi:hypothetical protein